MARLKNALLKGMSGAVAKTVVVKQYANGTVITSYPDMSKVKHTSSQKAKQKIFAKAVAYARDIIYDESKKAAYAKKLKKGVSVYHAAIKEYMNHHSR